MEETLEYLEQVLSGLKARFLAGDKSVEAKLRAVSAKVDQLKLTAEIKGGGQAAPNRLEAMGKKLANIVRRRSCCR